MKELYVFCEGPTEQGFCKQVLEPTPLADRLFHSHDLDRATLGTTASLTVAVSGSTRPCGSTFRAPSRAGGSIRECTSPP